MQLEIAVQMNNIPVEELRGIDRIYLGERFCVERYLIKLAEFAAFSKGSAIPVWLTTPEMVAESDLDRVAEATISHVGCFEGVLVADLGLAMLLRGRCRSGYKGTVLNKESAKQIVAALGIEYIRLYPPTIETIETLADVVNLEITVHGMIPLSSTPRCPVAGHRDCNDCETERTVTGGPKALLLRGNAIYSLEPVAAYGLVDRLQRMNVRTAVIEGLRLSSESVFMLSELYRGKVKQPGSKSSGCFFGFEKEKTYLASKRWMEMVDSETQ